MLFLNKIFYTCICCFWLRNSNWNAVKRHQQCNVSYSHSHDVVTRIIDVLWAYIVKNIFHPLTTFCSSSQLNFLLIKVVRESFSIVSNNIIIIIIIIGSHRQRRSVASTWNAHDGTGGLGTFSADAERGTVADLLYPRVARTAWASAPAGVKTGTGYNRRDLGQCTMSRSMIVESLRDRTVRFASWW